MIEKTFSFQAQAIDAVFEKTASEGSQSGEPTMDPRIAEFKKANPTPPGHVDLLINALGSHETYGPNRNGDAFPRDGLKHEPAGWQNVSPDQQKLVAQEYSSDPMKYGDMRPYGYTTFYNAHLFLHHQNKDPDKSVGDVIYVIYNDKMDRVELIARLNIDKAYRFGERKMVDAILAGKSVDTSMGCRVNYDVCSLCGNKAKTRAEYCIHVQRDGNPGMMKTMPDGRRAFVYNPFPNFFDMSLVYIGADRISKSMAKLSSVGLNQVAELVKAAAYSRGEFEKTASLGDHFSDRVFKSATYKTAGQKLAEILKNISPQEMTERVIPLLNEREPDLPNEDLDEATQLCGPEAVINGTARMGMVLKPREFTRIIIVGHGGPAAGDALDGRGECFRPTTDVTPMPLHFGITQLLRRILAPHMMDRSAFAPILSRRMLIIKSMPAAPQPENGVEDETLDKISALYNGYRLSLIKQASDLNKIACCDPDIVNSLYRMEKTASEGVVSKAPLALLALAPLMYLYSAHLKEQEMRGAPLGPLEEFAAANPGFMTALGVGGGAALSRLLQAGV